MAPGAIAAAADTAEAARLRQKRLELPRAQVRQARSLLPHQNLQLLPLTQIERQRAAKEAAVQRQRQIRGQLRWRQPYQMRDLRLREARPY